MAKHPGSKLANILSFARFCQGLEMPAAPLEIFLEISNVCDLKCAMCTEFSALTPHRFQFLRREQRGFLRTDDVETNMRDLLERALLVHCSGYGEPTIHPSFKEFITFVSQFEVMINFITNGMHIDAELAGFLVEKNVSRIMVSLSGTTKQEYENVYIGGDFDRVRRGIELIAEAKAKAGKRYPIIEVNSLAFRHHVARFDKFVEIMADAGANVVHLKKLQPYHHIPELFEHVSVMRPWVEGVTIRRAIAVGAARGVYVSCDQYAAEQVVSTEEYDARLAGFQQQAETYQPERAYGSNAIATFPEINKPQLASTGHGDGGAAVLGALSEEEARVALDIGPLPELDQAPFYCMEPFKTLYVRKDGAVKPCCFSNAPPFLGSIATQPGAEVWDGPGYRAFRDGIAAGEYPRPFCGRCVRERIGPSDHFADVLLYDFVRWFTASHGAELEAGLEAAEPNIFKILTRQRSAKIIADYRRRHDGQPPPVAASHLSDGQLNFMKVEGRLEQVEDDRAVGWAWVPQYPRYRVPIAVWAQDAQLASGVACRPRDDLLAAGKGDGYHGFSIPLPPGKTWSKDELRITAGRTVAHQKLSG